MLGQLRSHTGFALNIFTSETIVYIVIVWSDKVNVDGIISSGEILLRYLDFLLLTFLFCQIWAQIEIFEIF